MEALRERFGKYHVLDKIAQGGMAEVYKVKTVGIAGFEKIQALKRILPHSAREGRFIRSFIDEARIAVELTHRNIVQVFDFGKADGELFLAMELIEGKDLRTAMAEAVARGLAPSIPISAYIIGEVASGLDYAHRKTDGYGGQLGIVHCDVSPSNVMLSTDGGVKILDFGIARASFASALERRRLRGKPRYMAPEQTYGEPPTAAADVFALGIIAWELFTGRQLFRGTDVKTILDQVRRTTAPRVDSINPAIPSEIVKAIQTALSREPADRGTSADLAAACGRTALGGGARAVAHWLEDLDARPTITGIPWETDNSSHSLKGSHDQSHDRARGSVPRIEGTQDLGAVPSPAERYSMMAFSNSQREATASIADAPVPSSAPVVPSDFDDAAFGGETTRADGSPADSHFSITTKQVSTLVRGWGEAPDGGAGGPTFEPFATATHQSVTTPAKPPVKRDLLRTPPEGIREMTMQLKTEATSFDDLEVEPDPPRVEHTVALPADEPIDDSPQTIITPAPERRRAVVLGAVASGADPETLRALTRVLGELAYQRGGVVIALDDDALVVAFGLEVAGDADVAIAQGWAQDAQAVARDYREGVHVDPTAPHPSASNLRRPGGIELRVAIRTGIAIEQARTGPQLPREAVEEVRARARVAPAERPSFIAIGGERATSHAPPARSRGKLVGRTAQLAELDGWFQRAVAADRRLVVLVIGAAGTGKTRLVDELVTRRQATGQPLRTVTAIASPANHLAPFALVIELYQAALGLPPARGRAARAEVSARLSQMLARQGVPAERTRDVVVDLDRAMELRDGLALGAREPADLRTRISAGLATWRRAMADRARPLLTVIEDVHLADSASLEVLRHTMSMPGSGPELLVLTMRPEPMVGDPGWRPASDAVITVGELVGADLRTLVSERLGDAASPSNIAAVLSRGGGNPMQIEELARAVRDSAQLGGSVPASAQEVVSARLERLPERMRTSLRAAAVLGDRVRVPLLGELLERGPDLEPELDELVRAGFLVHSKRDDVQEHAPGEGVFEWARDLVRDVVYESMSARSRRDTHARVGRLLASRFFAGREEPPATIAEHLERGGEAAGAAAFYLRAGRLALTASDAPAAIACFTKTLDLERELGAAPPTSTSRARRREALSGREEANRLIGDLVANPTDLDDLERLCLGEPARMAEVSIKRALRLLRLGDFQAAAIATVVAEDHATSARDDRLRGEALRIRGEILERQGRFDDALAVVGAARDLFHQQRSVTDEMAAMIGRGRIHLLRGHYAAARDAYRPVLALIEKTGDPWLERIATNHIAVVELCLGNFELAMTAAERSLELCRRYGDRTREGDGLSVAGIILLEVGQLDRAAQTFQEALEILSRTASRWSRCDCLIYAGAGELRRNRAGALNLIEEAVAEARSLGARYLEANALITRADAHLARGHLDLALGDALAGVAAAQAAGVLGYEIQGLARQAVALSRMGNRHGDAGAAVHRALALLEQQVTLEGSEEVVLAMCYEVLRAAGADDRAARVKERGAESALRKLDGLTDPAWRASFAALPDVRTLLS